MSHSPINIPMVDGEIAPTDLVSLENSSSPKQKMVVGIAHTPYEVKTLQYEDGIFNHCIDATYVIHLRDNGRERRIFE